MLEVGISLFVLLALMLLVDFLQERRAVRMDDRMKTIAVRLSAIEHDISYLMDMARITAMKVELDSDVIIAGKNDENQRSKFAIPREPVIALL